MNRYLCLLSWLLLTGIACAQIPETTDLILRRGIVSNGDIDRLRKVFQKAESGQPIVIAALGGSITAGGQHTKDPNVRFVRQVSGWFEKKFPKSEVSFINAGIGGTNSIYGAMRVQGDVLDKKPDVVLVDFAVNNKVGKEYVESYEGVIRQILSYQTNPAVITIFFMHKDGVSEQPWLETIGRHYGLPMVSFRDAWFPEVYSGRLSWEVMYADIVHPSDVGHHLATALLVGVLENAYEKHNSSSKKVSATISKTVEQALISKKYEKCEFFRGESLIPSDNQGWVYDQSKKRWMNSEPQSSIEFNVKGRDVFVGFDIEKDFDGVVTYSIDGGEAKSLKSDGNRPPLAKDLASGAHTIKFNVAPKNSNPGSNTGQVVIWGVGGAYGD